MTEQRTLKKQVAALAGMSLRELSDKFEELFGFPTTQTNGKNLRTRLICKLQEIYLGGISGEDRQRLIQIAQHDPMANLKGNRTKKMLQGTRLQRVWKGETHEVIATERGTFEYAGIEYKSLSAVARKITGTRWNGKTFFGIKGK